MPPYGYPLRKGVLSSRQRAQILDIPGEEAAAKRLALIAERLEELTVGLSGEQREQLTLFERASKRYVDYRMDYGFVQGVFAGIRHSFLEADAAAIMVEYVECRDADEDIRGAKLLQKLMRLANNIGEAATQPLGILMLHQHRAEVIELRAFEHGYNHAVKLALEVTPPSGRAHADGNRRRLRNENACLP